MTQLQKLQDIIRKEPYLAWDTTKYDKISEEGIVERVLSYGDWKNFQTLEKILGLEKIKEIFEKLTNRYRVNLRPETINYFSKYLEKYA